MRIWFLSAALMLTACQSKPSNPLVANDWTNGKQPCSETNLSFKKSRIAYYPKDGQIPLFDILSIEPLEDGTEWILVQAKPAKELQVELAKQGLGWPSTSQPTFLFRVHDDRLSLAGLEKNTTERMHAPAAEQANRFNMVACPT